MSKKQNIVALQEDLFYSLMSWNMVEKLNIAQQRKKRLQNMADFATIYQTVRNGASGIGILVEMPKWRMSNNLSGPGPQTELLVSLLVVECPPINMVENGGTGTDAESVADLLLPFLHQWLIDGQGEFYPEATPIAEANDLPLGCLGYRVMVKMQHSNASLSRVPLPAQTIDGSFNVTLTDASGLSDVDVFYTLDESPPCVANTVATKYVGPFVVAVGDVVRWQAWKKDYAPSTIGRAEIAA